jgi:hypothetical protein
LNFIDQKLQQENSKSSEQQKLFDFGFKKINKFILHIISYLKIFFFKKTDLLNVLALKMKTG